MAPTTDQRALQSAAAIAENFAAYQTDFQALTRQAQHWFEQRAWQQRSRDASARLDLYPQRVQQVVAEVSRILGDQAKDPTLWRAIKHAYATRIAERPDCELAETFFNSITRRLFTTVGVDPDIEFVDAHTLPVAQPSQHLTTIFRRTGSLADLIGALLAHQALRVAYHDAAEDAELVSAAITTELAQLNLASPPDAIEMINAIFYRNKGAYIVGRLHCGAQRQPLVLSLLNTERGIIVDAVLIDADEVSILFSFTRSHFLVAVDSPRDLVTFLHELLPLKRVAELYTTLGYNKHGKTELYRDLLQHLATSSEQFEIAPGEQGMVMLTFTLPSYDLVFKIIKDVFAYPKNTTRAYVMSRYDLVFKHYRGGRLIEAHEFEHLRFEHARFAAPLLAELERIARNSMEIEGDALIIKHLYIERKVTPLNLYVKQTSAEVAKPVVIDYGQCIKDLAAANIFPGDILLKNFGVTRHGRVVFYDYDEICMLGECNFRLMPPARDDDDEFSPEPWFFVGEHDMFPEEFKAFLGLAEPLRTRFTEAHADLFGIEFWQSLQARHSAGEIMHIFPYPAHKRLPRSWWQPGNVL